MRILGYAKHWGKLAREYHTTFRLRRRDADRGLDWKVGEEVLEVVCPRASYASGKREIVGPSVIVMKEPRTFGSITDAEAIEDGFPGGLAEMWEWMQKAHPGIAKSTPVNKLTIRKIGV